MRPNILEEMYIFLFLFFFNSKSPQWLISPHPPLSPHEPPTVTLVPQMESTAGLPRGLEAGPVIWGSGNNHHFPTFSSHESPCGLHPARHLHSYHSISPIVYCPLLYQTIKGKRLSPPYRSGKNERSSRLFRSTPECKNDKSQQHSG